jgi:glucokinase
MTASAIPLYVGLDVGGTSMKAGVVDDTGTPLSNVSLPTEAEKGQEHGLRRMRETIELAVHTARVRWDQIQAVGVATPGTMDIPAGMILDPPNLKPWRNVPVRQYIEQQFGMPTAFQNDANAAAMGEYWVGAGQQVHSMVLYTLGTGVGGGIIIGHQVLEGEHSHGAELGHMVIDITQPRRCGCGRLGCLEAYASATSVARRAEEALAQSDGRSSLAQLARANGALTARDVFDAAAQGDGLADKIVEDTAYYLAVGTTNLMHSIDPDMVVFGGGMVAAGVPFLKRLQKHIQQLAFPVPAARTAICLARLGSDAGFIGAAACGRQLQTGALFPRKPAG